jgi:membrane protein YqaA with SNARE-associated domain
MMAAYRFVGSRAARAIAFAWGLGEATVFFIVPDVFLTLVACRSLGRALEGTLLALGGALVGGTVMFSIGLHAPERARALLDAVPGVQPALIADVREQLHAHGLLAMALGPARGTPYKIYAVEWGACGGRLLPFILVSVPARWVRFALTAAATRGAMRLLAPLTGQRAGVELALVGLVWVAVYAAYFAHFGW